MSLFTQSPILCQKYMSVFYPHNFLCSWKFIAFNTTTYLHLLSASIMICSTLKFRCIEREIVNPSDSFLISTTSGVTLRSCHLLPATFPAVVGECRDPMHISWQSQACISRHIGCKWIAFGYWEILHCLKTSFSDNYEISTEIKSIGMMVHQ